MDFSGVFIRVEDVILYVKDYGLKICFILEDIMRMEWKNFIVVLNFVREFKVDRVSIVDIIGVVYFFEFYDFVKCVVEFGIFVNVYCYNDLGLVLVNVIMGIEVGVMLVDVIVNGIGERVGIVDLFYFLVVFYYYYGVKKYRLEKFYLLSRFVSEIIGF